MPQTLCLATAGPRIEQVTDEPESGEVERAKTKAKLQLVDLAGSERSGLGLHS